MSSKRETTLPLTISMTPASYDTPQIALSPTYSTKERTYPKRLSSRQEDQPEQTEQIPRRYKCKKKRKTFSTKKRMREWRGRERKREGRWEPEWGGRGREAMGNGRKKEKIFRIILCINERRE